MRFFYFFFSFLFSSKLQSYDQIETFHGYGTDQTFRHLPIDAETILKGDSLTFVCTFNSIGNSNSIYYGVSHGDEMCAPLILYYPHVKGKQGNTNVNMISFEISKTRKDDVSGSKIILKDLI